MNKSVWRTALSRRLKVQSKIYVEGVFFTYSTGHDCDLTAVIQEVVA